MRVFFFDLTFTSPIAFLIGVFFGYVRTQKLDGSAPTKANLEKLNLIGGVKFNKVPEHDYDDISSCQSSIYIEEKIMMPNLLSTSAHTMSMNLRTQSKNWTTKEKLTMTQEPLLLRRLSSEPDGRSNHVQVKSRTR